MTYRGVFLSLCLLLVTSCSQGGATDQRELQEVLRNSLLNRWQGSDNDVLKKIADDEVQAGFSWSDCTSSKAPAVKVNDLKLGPSPLRIPGNITLAVDGQVNVDIAAPIELTLEVKKKMLFWITIPCVDNVGSCTYSDICPLLEKVLPTCPPEFIKNNIPCHCPAKKGTYSLPSSNIFVDPKESIPSWLEKGEYQVEAKLKQNGSELFCVHINLSIEASKS